MLKKEDVIYEFNFDLYDKQKLIAEANSRIYHKYEADIKANFSDKGWFKQKEKFVLENWKQATFFGYSKDGEDHIDNYKETKKVTDYFKNILQSDDIRPRFYILDSNTSVPEHTDQNTKCGINIILSKDAGPIRFKNVGDYFYNTALLNVSQTHDVPAWPGEDRLLLKISIMDVDFYTAKERLENARTL